MRVTRLGLGPEGDSLSGLAHPQPLGQGGSGCTGVGF